MNTAHGTDSVFYRAVALDFLIAVLRHFMSFLKCHFCHSAACNCNNGQILLIIPG